MACTIKVSASQRATPDPFGEQPATFMGATPDGSKVFFTSSGKLTDDATTGPIDFGHDLYRYDVKSGTLVDVSVDTDPGDFFFGADVQGVLGASSDGSYVYFVANGVLTPGATPGGCFATVGSSSGECSLYLWHNGVTTLIAPVKLPGDHSNFAQSFLEKTARVSADGKALLFGSNQKLTDYDNEGTYEFYRYSAAEDDLLCVTCNPSGRAPIGAPALRSIDKPTKAQFSPSILTRNLSADGNRVFFETSEKLVAADTNGDASCDSLNGVGPPTFCQDVYEWEAKGSGTCHSEAQNGGCLYLLSTGTGTDPAFFADASPSGNDAFIFTVDRLVGQDGDQILDIYDARVGGGIASQNPPPPPVPCEGEGCKSGSPPPPGAESPGTATFAGPGNQKASQHKKKRRHQHKKKRHHHKRHASRKHG